MGTWNVYSDAIEPIDVGLSREEAKRIVDSLIKHQPDVYAENMEIGETYEP